MAEPSRRTRETNVAFRTLEKFVAGGFETASLPDDSMYGSLRELAKRYFPDVEVRKGRGVAHLGRLRL